MTLNKNGLIIYQGPSLLDGMPIVAIVTGLTTKSANSKTGAELQTWILRADISPRAALDTGADASICGDCPHRPTADGKRTCYVRIDNAPRAVYECFKRGNYATADFDDMIDNGHDLYDRVLRIGSYGDPAAVPVGVWDTMAGLCAHHTGYTHQWKTHQNLAHLCMASVDSVGERAEAKLRGFRTFRPRGSNEQIWANEISCPASEEAGRKTTCENCKLCSGTSSNSPKSITIQIHGPVSNATKLAGIAA